MVRPPSVEPSFAAAVSAITDAFGDPTRRSVYLLVRESPDVNGVTAGMVAGHVGVHPNVARRHLDKLAAGGYLAVTSGPAGPRGAGRPSKRYVVVADDDPAGCDGVVPVRTDDLLLALLSRAIELLPPAEAEAMAEDVGTRYGRALAVRVNGAARTAGQRSLRSAMRSVADALTANGFAAHSERKSDRLRIVNNHCPFGTVAVDHPVICAVDRGLVRGMLGALAGDDATGSVLTEASKAFGDDICATAFGNDTVTPS